MKTINHAKTFVLITIAMFSAQAHAVGGTIAVGLNEANQLDTVQVSFAADATIETAEFSVTERIYYVPGMTGFDGGGFADRMAEAAKQAAEEEAENEVRNTVGTAFKKLFGN